MLFLVSTAGQPQRRQRPTQGGAQQRGWTTSVCGGKETEAALRGAGSRGKGWRSQLTARRPDLHRSTSRAAAHQQGRRHRAYEPVRSLRRCWQVLRGRVLGAAWHLSRQLARLKPAAQVLQLASSSAPAAARADQADQPEARGDPAATAGLPATPSAPAASAPAHATQIPGRPWLMAAWLHAAGGAQHAGGQRPRRPAPLRPPEGVV